MGKAEALSHTIRQHMLRMSVLALLMSVGLAYVGYLLYATQQEWSEAVELRDPRPIAVSRLRHQLGYGGLVHHYLNAILRPDAERNHTTTFDLGAVRGAMLDFQTLDVSPLERTSLSIIDDVLDDVDRAVSKMETGYYAGLTPEEVYAQLDVDLDRMANAVNMLAAVSFGEVGSTPPHHQLLSEFEAAIGLNGIIHHLKTYLLTGDLATLDQAYASVERARSLLDQLQARAGSMSEREAVRVIRRTVDEYAEGIETARSMVEAGKPAGEIDSAIRVDDMPAISAYATLMSFEMARLEKGTVSVGNGLFTARTMTLGMIVLLLVPLCVQFIHMSLSLMRAVPQWRDTLSDIADGLAKEEFDKNQDYGGLPAELAALEEPFTAIRRTLWFRREQALEGEAQVDTIAAENDQLSAKLGTIRADLDAATKRAEQAEGVAKEASKEVHMIGGVIEALSQGVLATRGFDDILFWNPRLAELTNVPADWFAREHTLRELVLYLATRGDYGPGDPISTAGKVIETIDRELEKGVYRYDQTFAGERVLALEIVRQGDGTIVFSATDITQRHEQAVAMEQQAISDPLTGLANRTALNTFTTSMLEHTKRSGETAAILALDLDGFKPVNDKYGHGAGDEVLVELSRRLEEEVRDTDFVARTGGDEFIIVMLHLEDGEGAVRFAQRLLRAIEVPIRISAGTEISLSGSIGVSVFPEDADDSQALYRMADEALYVAKDAGRNCVRSYKDVVLSTANVAQITKPASSQSIA